MKNKRFNKRVSRMSGILLASILFLACAPMSLFGAACLGIGTLAMNTPEIMKYVPMPTGILGENPPVTEAEKEVMLLKKIKEGVIEKFNDLIANDANFKTLKDLAEKMKEAKTEEQLVTIKAQIEEVGLSIKALKEAPATVKKGKTLKAAMMDAVAEAATKGDLMKLKEGDIKNLTLKVAGTMTTANIDAIGTGNSYLLTENEMFLTRIVRRMPFIQQLINMGTTVKKIIQWVEQKNPDPGSAGMTAEGAAKTQMDFDLVEASAEVKKITAYIKVSREMLDDVDFMQSEIDTEIMELLKLKLDEQILTGDNIGQNLNGILTLATAFDAGVFADQIPSANNADVLRVAINQIEIATPNGPFLPNFIVLHPSDAAAMDLAKDAENRYLIYPFMSKDNTVVKGIPIITNIGMTEGEFLVMDGTKSRCLIRKEAALNVGYENDDFTKNLVTILGEIRAVHYIKSNYVKAFVTGTFADAKVDLDPALT